MLELVTKKYEAAKTLIVLLKSVRRTIFKLKKIIRLTKVNCIILGLVKTVVLKALLLQNF